MIVTGAHMISFMDMLSQHCAVAADILTQQNIDPQFFAFRWMTLLFSQEFPLSGAIDGVASCLPFI